MEEGVLFMEETVEGMADSAIRQLSVVPDAESALGPQGWASARLAEAEEGARLSLEGVQLAMEICTLAFSMGEGGGEVGGIGGFWGENGGKVSLPAELEEEWPKLTARWQEDVVRLFLTSGLAESAAGLWSPQAQEEVARWRHLRLPLWNLVAESALKAPDRLAGAALQAVSLWEIGGKVEETGENMGVKKGIKVGHVAALYRLLRDHNSPVQQSLAFQFLYRPGVIGGAVLAESGGEELGESEEEVGGSTGVHAELAVVLDVPEDEILDSELDSPLRVGFSPFFLSVVFT